MFFEDYDDRDGKKVWLSQREVAQLLDVVDDRERQLGMRLGVRCGLRTDEIIDVAPQHVVDGDERTWLRVFDGKGDKYRQTPVPQDLATTLRTIDDYRDEPSDEPVVPKSTRSLRRWMQDAREQLLEETDEPGWQYLEMHDLRRTWASSLRNEDVDAMVVCDWGGWEDLETFMDHYRGTSTPEAQRREAEKVSWL